MAKAKAAKATKNDADARARRPAAKPVRVRRTFMGIEIVDPAVKPKGTTVQRIREAVAAAHKRA